MDRVRQLISQWLCSFYIKSGKCLGSKLGSVIVDAVFIALLMGIPSHYGLFDSFDKFIFAKASAVLGRFLEPKRLHNAVVLEVDQVFYDKYFEGVSPLQRKKLGKLVSALTSAGMPIDMLVIDLDISPRSSEIDNSAPAAFFGCESLDPEKFPVEHALCNPASTVSAVLLAPFPASSKAAAAKYQWMKFICSIGKDHRHDFAFGDIPKSKAIYTTEYFRMSEKSGDACAVTLKTLADVSAKRVHGNVKCPVGLCEDLLRAEQDSGALLLKDQKGYLPVPVEFGFLDRLIVSHESPSPSGTLHEQLLSRSDERQLLNMFDLPKRIKLSTYFCKDDECEINDKNIDKLSEQLKSLFTTEEKSVIFLGGSWDSGDSDVFETPEGRLPGVNLHAMAYSNEHVTSYGHLIMLVLEVIAGVIMIYVFGYLWKNAEHQINEIDKYFHDTDTWKHRACSIVKYLMWLLAIPSAGFFFMFVIAGLMLMQLTALKWVAPTALLLSILLKTYLERHEGAEQAAEKVHGNPEHPPRTCIAFLLSKLPQGALVLWSLSLLDNH